MKALTIPATRHTRPALVLQAAACIAAALLAAVLLGALLSNEWTLPMDPTFGSAFTA